MEIDFYNDKISDEQVVIALLYGEARLQEDCRTDEIKEMLAIGCTVKNRIKIGRWGYTWKSVILAPMQFSCFNEKDPNREKIWNFVTQEQHTDLYKGYQYYAKAIMDGRCKDWSDGSTHYVAEWFYANRNKRTPSNHWIYDPSMEIRAIFGGHVFLRDRILWRKLENEGVRKS